ncbi:hypothetical protein EP7_003073 [Isosphaeraceae bacterium EP7]
MAEAKVRSLTIRPFQSADLAFNESGILDAQNAQLAKLGEKVDAFNLQDLYSRLGETLAGDHAKLKFASEEIESFLSSRYLFALRRESLRASLDEAMIDRENNFLERFSHKALIIAELRKLYPLGITGDSKVSRLQAIATASSEQFTDMMALLTAQGRLGVIEGPSTASIGTSAANSTGKSHTDGTNKSDSQSKTELKSKTVVKTDTTSDSTTIDDSTITTTANLLAIKTRAIAQQPDAPANAYYLTVRHNVHLADNHVEEPTDFKDAARHVTSDTVNVPMVFDGGWKELEATEIKTHNQVAHGDSVDHGTSLSNSEALADVTSMTVTTANETITSDGTNELITNSSFEQNANTREPIYSHPSSEARMRFHRAQASLQDELLNHTVFGLRSAHFERLFDNQLKMIDLRLRQLQVALAQRFLISPIKGVITGIYKDLGEQVNAGEAVVRVENHEDVLIVGRVQSRSMVRLGGAVKLTAKNVLEAAAPEPVTLNGTVAAMRGHDADNDEWDLVLFCDNRGPGNTTKLPINYNFDKDDVTLELL